MKKGWYLTSQPIITANWEVSNSGRWVAPFGGGVGRIHEARIPASEYQCAILWQRRPSARSFALEHAVAACVPVSQAEQGAGEDASAAKTETHDTAAAAEEDNVMPLSIPAASQD